MSRRIAVGLEAEQGPGSLKFFRRVGTGLCSGLLAEELAALGEGIWNTETEWNAKAKATAIAGVPNLVLRYNVGNPVDQWDWDRELWHKLESARDLVFQVMGLVRGQVLGRVTISRLVQGGSIAPHFHRGRDGRFSPYETFQIPLAGQTEFTCGEAGAPEVVHMVPGEAWWVDTRELHSVKNIGPCPRLALMADIRPYDWR